MLARPMFVIQLVGSPVIQATTVAPMTSRPIELLALPQFPSQKLMVEAKSSHSIRPDGSIPVPRGLLGPPMDLWSLH